RYARARRGRPRYLGLDVGLRIPLELEVLRTRSARTDEIAVNWLAMSDQAVAPHPHPVVGQLAALHHFRTYVDIGVVVVVLALTNLIAHFTTPWASIATVPAAAVGLLVLVRSRGLGWAELGLGREHWKTGALYALGAVLLVLTAIAVAALLPWTRPMFLNNHYATLSGALVASMIII